MSGRSAGPDADVSVGHVVTDDVETFVARSYNWPQSGVLQTGGGRFSGQLRYLQTPKLKLHTRLFGAPAIVDWVVTDSVVHLFGPIDIDPDSRLLGRPLGATQAVAMAPGRDGIFALPRPGMSWAIIIDRDLLARALRDVNDCSLEAGLAAGEARRWTADGLNILVLRILAGGTLDRSSAALEAMVAGAVANHLADGHTPLVAGAAFRLARRARDCMIDHADQPISLPKLAAALGVGQRSVFNAFGEIYGMPPKAFQRALQLDRVRRRLLTAPVDTTVTMLAFDEGIEHLGRFAGAYRRQFGELPRDTLSRARHALRNTAA